MMLINSRTDSDIDRADDDRAAWIDSRADSRTDSDIDRADDDRAAWIDSRAGRKAVNLQEALQAWHRARSELTQARRILVGAIRRELAAGRSQSEIARALGWSRQRVHKALLLREDSENA